MIWERYGNTTNKEGVGIEYALGILDAVRGLVIMVCVDDILEYVCNTGEYKSSLNRTMGANGRDTWEDELFYDNSFLWKR